MTDLERRVIQLERKERTRALAERRAQLQKDGLIGHVHNPLTDRAIKNERCDECGAKALEYLGGVCTIEPPHSQVEFYRCRKCGFWAEEI